MPPGPEESGVGAASAVPIRARRRTTADLLRLSSGIKDDVFRLCFFNFSEGGALFLVEVLEGEVGFVDYYGCLLKRPSRAAVDFLFVCHVE